jgi:nitrogen-specific signal transduction histidine kinase/ActR/RegA family two-component response regulator
LSVGEGEEDGKPIFVGIIHDLSERKRTEGLLVQAQKMEAIGQLTGGIAHDFNNLLTVILGTSEILVDGLNGNQPLRSVAEMIQSAAERGAALTKRMLAFARRQPLEPRIVDINKLLAGMDVLLRRSLGEEVDLEIVLGPGLWPALIDPAQLESAILNLCLNARDAMAGGGHLTIESANARLNDVYAAENEEVQPGCYVMIAVTDTGTGMTPDTAARAFDPFFTTKDVGKGSGLGLSMIYGFLKQSGGHVKIYSEVGYGTTMKCYLPGAFGSEEEIEAREVSRQSGGNELILLVEDDDLVRGYVEAQLLDLGYRVKPVRDGSEALEAVQNLASFDLLFTDIVMPGGMNGHELAERVLMLRPGTRVLFTSGYNEAALVHSQRLGPGLHILSKPYRKEHLAAKIRTVLDSD